MHVYDDEKKKTNKLQNGTGNKIFSSSFHRHIINITFVMDVMVFGCVRVCHCETSE